MLINKIILNEIINYLIPNALLFEIIESFIKK